MQRDMADALLRWHKSDAPNTDQYIADLGCGTGYLLEQLQQRGFNNLYGFDIADRMLEAVRSGTTNASVKLTQADLQALPVPDQQFDVVFSNAAVQWCDTERAAAEIQRVLRQGGRGFISTFGPQTLEQWRSVFQSHGHRSVHFFDSSDALKETFEKSGLSINQIETKLITQSFHCVKDMFDSIKKLGASNATAIRKPISKSVYQSIHTEFQQQLTKDGILTLTYEAISFEAVRR